MPEEMDHEAADNPEGGGGRRRRRRRRRRRGSGGDEGGGNHSFPDDVLLMADGGGGGEAPDNGQQRRSRRQVDIGGPSVSLPASGRNPYRKRSTRARRGAPSAPSGRRRRLSRTEVDSLAAWLKRMPESLVAVLYRGLGGQPDRVATGDRMIQLAVRALAQGNRLGTLVKALNERERKALAGLLQAGGVAHADEFRRELQLSYGGHDHEWQRVMVNVASKGMAFASQEVDGQFFYVVPEPLVDGLLAELGQELSLPVFSHPEVRVMDAKPFCPPLHFSITSLATYVDQFSPRLTQRHEIYRHDQEAMDQFFSQVWEPDSELFSFHLQFLMMHGMVELRGEYLALNRDVMEEWLQLEAEDQRDLLFRALDQRFDLAEWVLWSIHAATQASLKGVPEGESGGDWVAERPLVAVYRRWKRGEDWRDRYTRGQFANVRGSERESYSFAPLVRAGILEMGQWGQEKFYRLSPRGRQMLEPAGDDGFQQFYLTPSFEIMAPAGLAPILLFRIGELAELVGCDRANTYKITEPSVERGLERGWRRDDVLQFLRDNSQIGLPDNVEATLKGWIGHRGDVEFHDVTLLTVHRSQIRRLEGHKKIKPYILHRFAPGMYAVDRSRLQEVVAVLQECRFSPSKELRQYPGDPEQVEARNALRRQVAEAREAAVDPAQRGSVLARPEDLHPVPGAKAAKGPEQGGNAEPEMPPEVTPEEVRQLIDVALSEDRDLEMVYVAKTGQRLALMVQPQRIAFKAEAPVLVGLDRNENERRSFVLDKIERLRLVDPVEAAEAPAGGGRR
ncbi:MAG: helicase-associated domain-containing protein [Myxococcota bacterium]